MLISKSTGHYRPAEGNCLQSLSKNFANNARRVGRCPGKKMVIICQLLENKKLHIRAKARNYAIAASVPGLHSSNVKYAPIPRECQTMNGDAPVKNAKNNSKSDATR
jgi:hypothetical protein